MPTLAKNLSDREALIAKREEIQKKINILSLRIATARNYLKNNPKTHNID